jgi:serine protease Do
MKKNLSLVVIAFLSGMGGAFTFFTWMAPNPNTPTLMHEMADSAHIPPYYQQTRTYDMIADNAPDFVKASAQSTKSVVYIKNISERTMRRSYLDWFFGDGAPSTQTQVSSGSGVIFTDNGYIITNNHVIDGADRVEVIHNKKTYQANVVGTDPSTDLAVLKIDAKNLPAITVGKSKELAVGEWVLAVGNPFNLTSTVTAGIVSAKGREINILQSKFPIESFIQTDAAINPGNSGGALVNTRGQLVGINTAILSKTGTYTGYGFAVPVDIVKKIVGDIIEYGEVQKAFFGADVADINSDIAKRLDIDITKNSDGVVINFLQKEGAASKVGLKEGDIITALNGSKVDSRAMFEEELSYYSPGDKVDVTYLRGKKENKVTVVLTNREGTTGVLKREILTSERLGAEFEAVPKVERDLLGIENGVRVFNISQGLVRNMGISEDFVVTKVNGVVIKSPEMLVDFFEQVRERTLKGKVVIEGINNRGKEGYYSFFVR